MCPSLNARTGAARSTAEHPLGLLRPLHSRVSVNTDNRLMSATSVSRKLMLVARQFSHSQAELQWFTVNAMKSTLIGFDERLRHISLTQMGICNAALTGTSPSASSAARLGSVVLIASVVLPSQEDTRSSEASSSP